MFTSTDLRAIITEARPIVERMLDDAELIAGFRTTVTDAGGDWGQVKALVKAMIQDERDEAGGNKRVTALLERADHVTGYAEMLGIGNLNEKNSFGDDTATDEAGDLAPHESTAARMDVHGLSLPVDGSHPPSVVTEPAEEHRVATVTEPTEGTQAPPVDTTPEQHPAALQALKLRPYCLHADDLRQCGGVGKKHCFTCQKAHADDVGETA